MFPKSVALAGLLAGSLLFAMSASAEDNYPTRPITLVVPNTAGGGLDVVARDLATPLSQRLGQPVVIVNKAGGGGTIGAGFVAHSKPDGYTLLFGSPSNLVIVPNLRNDLPYDSFKDLAPVSFLGELPYFLVAHPDVASSVEELLAKAKANPGSLNYGATGQGSNTQIAPMLFLKLAGVDIQEVIYQGLANEIPDLLANRVQIAFGPEELLTHVQNGNLNALAVTTMERSPLMPDVPTLDESGVKGYELSAWYGIMASGGTPDAIIEKLNTEINAILENDETYKATAAKRGFTLNVGSPEDLRKRMTTEFATMGELLKNIKQ